MKVRSVVGEEGDEGSVEREVRVEWLKIDSVGVRGKSFFLKSLTLITM